MFLIYTDKTFNRLAHYLEPAEDTLYAMGSAMPINPPTSSTISIITQKHAGGNYCTIVSVYEDPGDGPASMEVTAVDLNDPLC